MLSSQQGHNHEMRRAGAGRAVLALFSAAALAVGSGTMAADVTPERLINADKEPHNWMMYYGNYRGWRYSGLDQINATNVQRLTVKWTFIPGAEEDFQATPIVVDGVMYLTSAANNVFALDAATGKMLWRYNHKFPEKMPVALWGPSKNRGVAIAGDSVLLATGDGRLIALAAKDGKVRWNTQAADYKSGLGFGQPPLVVGNKAIVGTFTAEFATRGFVAAYDLHTGKEVWKFNTIPGPGDPGHDTWAGDSWKYGCGPVILPPTFDTAANLIYVGTGNPCPMWNGEVRPGDNLYTNSVLALNPETGKLAWHYQMIPHDVWDLDAFGEVVLVDSQIQGRSRKAALQAGKGGYLYALDRLEGRYLYAKPFVPNITWAKGLDDNGKPIPGAVPTDKSAKLCPGALSGGKSWNQTAYSPVLDYWFVPAGDVCDEVKQVAVNPAPNPGDLHLGGESANWSNGGGFLHAIDVKTGAIKWTYRSRYPMRSSVLATAGGLLFTGDLESNVLALRANDGAVLWKFSAGSMPQNSMTYSAKGEQFVAVGVGWGQVLANFMPAYVPELADLPRGSVLMVFGLPK